MSYTRSEQKRYAMEEGESLDNRMMLTFFLAKEPLSGSKRRHDVSNLCQIESIEK